MKKRASYIRVVRTDKEWKRILSQAKKLKRGELLKFLREQGIAMSTYYKHKKVA